MNNIQKLKSEYQNHTFTSGGQTGSDYKQFENKYKRIIKSIAENIGGKMVAFNSGHYYFSSFIEKDGQYVYVSISDVRNFTNEWKDNILVRTANSKKDYRGGRNTYSTLDTLENNINKKFK